MRIIAFLVPAHNEAEVIGGTLASLVKITRPDNIYVVSDGSVDRTVEIANKFTANVLAINPNRGKAGALNAAIDYFRLAKRYEYVMPMDADTRVDQNFWRNARHHFKEANGRKIVAVVGKVNGRAHNWVTLYRLWEYEVAQSVHKRAQSVEGAIIVSPGCATVFRSEVFKKHQIPDSTLTEDMDLTFLIHREKIGRIVYEPEATVSTQDPQTLKDLLKQLTRWYTGYWQNMVKHRIPWGGQALDAELALLTLEALFNGLTAIGLLVIGPIAFFNQPLLFLLPFGIDLALFFVPTLVMTAVRHRTMRVFRYVPHFYLIRFLSSMVFLGTFFKVVFGVDVLVGWNKAKRYRPAEVIT